jgi:hypothetical protein
MAASDFYHRSKASRNAADSAPLQFFRSPLVAARDLVGHPFNMIVTIKKAAAMAIFLFSPEPPEEPLVGCLVGQIIGIEHSTPDTPEIFHGKHLP